MHWPEWWDQTSISDNIADGQGDAAHSCAGLPQNAGLFSVSLITKKMSGHIEAVPPEEFFASEFFAIDSRIPRHNASTGS